MGLLPSLEGQRTSLLRRRPRPAPSLPIDPRGDYARPVSRDDWDEEDLEDEDDLYDLDSLEDEITPPPLVEATIALHEMYCALVEGGFDESDALRIIAYAIAEQGLAE